jgi:hypothetical protein
VPTKLTSAPAIPPSLLAFYGCVSRLELCYEVYAMLRRLLAVGLPAALVSGCASPTLPLPPQEVPTIAPASDSDHVKLVAGCGGADANAIIVVVNENLSVPADQAVSGARADGCGAWDAIVYAHSGDVLQITQDFASSKSPPTVIRVR